MLFAITGIIAPLLPTAFINAGRREDRPGDHRAARPAPARRPCSTQAQQAEQILLADPNVELVQTSIPGEGEAGFQTVFAAMSGLPANSARMTVRLDDSVDLTAYSVVLSNELAPGQDQRLRRARVGGGRASPPTASTSSSRARTRPTWLPPTTRSWPPCRDNPDLLNLKTDLSKGTPEIQVTPDPNKAIMVGLTAAQVAQEVRSALVGTVATRVVIDANGATTDMFVQLDPATIGSVEDLGNLPVGTVMKVPLSKVATVQQVDAQGSITRIGQAPAASISAEIASENTGKVSQDVQAEIDALVAQGKIPQGVDVRLAGVTQQMNEAFGGLFFSMGVAVLVVYVAMVLTFNSLITPFIILFSLPLATIGALPALYFTDRPLGVSALIGFLMLIGIVVTNAIVMLDLVERLRRQGMSTHDALIEGGRTRVRPILMTAIATILALIPLAAGFNQGSIIASELGTVVIGGLFSSTFLTLLVIPVIYSLVDGVRVRISSWRAQGVEAEGAPTAA